MQFTFASVLALAATSMALGSRSAEDGVSARKHEILSARGDGAITCQDTDHVYQGSERDNFSEGLDYLRGLGSNCGTDAGKCSRVSCSNDGAIFVCSQDDKEHSGLDCGQIADYVDNISDECQQNTQYFYQLVVGTQDNTDGWRVEVGYNSC